MVPSLSCIAGALAALGLYQIASRWSGFPRVEVAALVVCQIKELGFLVLLADVLFCLVMLYFELPVLVPLSTFDIGIVIILGIELICDYQATNLAQGRSD